jgi:hypothetical protein
MIKVKKGRTPWGPIDLTSHSHGRVKNPGHEALSVPRQVCATARLTPDDPVPQRVPGIDTVARWWRVRVHTAPAAAIAAPRPIALGMPTWPGDQAENDRSEAQTDVDRGARCSGRRAAL